MPRAKVGSHTRSNPNGGTTRVTSHTRRTRGARPSPFTFSPGRAGRNFTRAFRAAKNRKKLAAGLLATAGVAEIAGFLTFKTAGGLLVGTGLLLGAVGGALWLSARR